MKIVACGVPRSMQLFTAQHVNAGCMSDDTRASLTTVLEVERELEGLLESVVGASHRHNQREFSESRPAHNGT